jgi:hypothetical protein
MASSGIIRRVAPVRIDVSEEFSPSNIRVRRIVELGITLNLKTTFFIVTAVKTSNPTYYCDVLVEGGHF